MVHLYVVAICPTGVPRLVCQRVRNRCQVSCSQITAYFMPVSVLNRLPAKCFLRGPTRRKSVGSIVPTELVPGYGVMAPGGGGGGLSSLQPLPSAVFETPYEPPCWEAICSRRQRRTRCHLLATDNDFLYARNRVFVPRWRKCLNINGDFVEL